MKAKILLALDGSEASMRTARYVANLLGNQADVSVTLFHILLPTPPSLLESGSLEGEVELERQRADWVKAEQTIECQLFDPIRVMFQKAGFHSEKIQSKCPPSINKLDVAHEILTECEQGDYDTVVMGKRGQSRIRTFLTGSVTEKVVRYAKGCAVWVIE